MLTIKDLLEQVKTYNPKEVENLRKAYDLENELHAEANTMVGVFVNGEYVLPDHTLRKKDRVLVVTDDFSFSLKEDRIDKAGTTQAKRKSKGFNKK